MRNFTEILLKPRPIAPYRAIDSHSVGRIKKLAKKLKGRSIIHVNSAFKGGGVAELLKSQIPLEKGLGLNSRWLVLRAPANFFEVTKKIHNLFQGQPGILTDKEKRTYLKFLTRAGSELSGIFKQSKNSAMFVIHDPQPLPLVEYLPDHAAVISRLHIDISGPNRLILDFLRPFINKANRIVVSNKAFRLKGVASGKTLVSYPAIDPFIQKNNLLSSRAAGYVLKKLGVDTSRPIIAQVSRFDRWKDPLGVLQAYYLAKKHFPNLQLILVGSLRVEDDPEAREIYLQIKRQIFADSDVFLITEKSLSKADPDRVVNAVQSGVDIVIQKSLREGFGLTVTEAMWKGKPVIGGNALGIKAQIKNNKEGLVVKNPEDCARGIVKLLRHPVLAKQLGKNARQTAKKKFLMNRLLEDFLKLYAGLSS
ncbi:MAG: glycosyl transferase family 1 [Candidatus Doudnabacteria bacterium CG10_big_fil_rev_8_21_14_0_10_42_18]|uniref:Glycosyl transferase family 1 n=1 Tax=Candidatus Doudnabacteria bacterium CG10_big_fil_rev_8_21_14_0_10_42_18 TaxID=1974552 RepID=A0A2H0VB49_9BACT|nr:MAG: glycosyl transferase family 1 [Candidatus Doudnabacteria bacterium CG10_big_fil_rev_8_21_14_0_10_42_18]